MYIKNQRGKMLVEATGSILIKQVGYINTEYMIIIQTPQLREETLGTYATEERAVQIINLIADAMFHHEGVYEMPDE